MTATPERQPRSRRISTAALARVEGEGAMSVRIRGRDVLEVQDPMSHEIRETPY